MRLFYFDKKIYYIDYYENGSRISNAGFISLTFKNDDCHVHVGIRNLPGVENRLCRWFGLINSEQVFLEEFRVEKGEADFVSCYKRNSLGRTEVDFSALEGFYFALGKRRWGSCFFRNIKQHMEPTFQEKPVKRTARTYSSETSSDGNTEEMQILDRNVGSSNNRRYDDGFGIDLENGGYEDATDADLENGGYEDVTGTDLESGGYDDSIGVDPESGGYEDAISGNSESWEYVDEMNGNSESELHSSDFRTDSQEQKHVHRTTWEELTETHQLVHPFEDQGDYISINPFTLKLLAPEYRKLANNSFLLHGFYNYRHLILGYYQDDERQGYYIGVPGTFDEREQMVAEMFGFEGYEPAGGVGYYMRKVEF
ncbi:MAG: hypothetical protein K2K17_08085 [Lachnospiraceae bacterium]|nr:hypothetical protein [Lachnospiraceae bacterium]